MNEPIPVSLALKAVERAIKECDAAKSAPWLDTSFSILARAGFRGTLGYIQTMLRVISGTLSPGWRTE